MIIQFQQKSTRFLFLLLIADLLFIAVHALYKMNVFSNPLFSIEKDFGYAEVYQYIKEYWIAALLIIAAFNKRLLILVAWALLFGYFLLDDSLQIHETFGDYLARSLQIQPMFNLRAQDFGELIVSAAAGTVLFSFLGLAYLYSHSSAREVSRQLFLLVICMVFFGILVDMLQIAIPWGRTVWGMVEDGGEMVIMSVIVWYVYHIEMRIEQASTVLS